MTTILTALFCVFAALRAAGALLTLPLVREAAERWVAARVGGLSGDWPDDSRESDE